MLFLVLGGLGVSAVMGVLMAGLAYLHERTSETGVEEVRPEESEYDKNRRLFEKTGKRDYLVLMEQAMEKDIPKEDDE